MTIWTTQQKRESQVIGYLKAKAILSGAAIKISHYVMIASAEPISVVLTQPAKFSDTILHVHRCIPHRQGALTMGPAAMKFENLVKLRSIIHGNHPLLDAAVEGCVLTNPDQAGNRYPAKDRSISRIDPLIAAIMATNWACHPPKDMPSGGAYNSVSR